EVDIDDESIEEETDSNSEELIDKEINVEESINEENIGDQIEQLKRWLKED
ncbi:unnamed protein product, partial [marine sediment metagenome]